MKKILVILVLLIGVVGCSSKSKSVDFKKIESDLLSSSYFKNHEVISKDTIEKRYSLDLKKAKNVLMIASKDYNDASMILIADKDVKDEIDSFVSAYNDQWVKMNYFPEEAELVKKASYQTIDNYVVYIVSSDNNSVLKLINL